jgi:hypothetical protein
VDSQHKKINGYRDLSQTEIDAMNTCKAAAVDIGALVDQVFEIEGVDRRWASIAKTDLQRGFMALVRSIAKPETF